MSLVFSLVAGGTGALAHGFYRRQVRVWSDGTRCLKAGVVTAHGAYDSGKFVTRSSSRRRADYAGACALDWYKRDGSLRARVYVLKRLRGGTAGICYDSGWRFSDRRAKGWRVKVLGPRSGRPLCGRGRYKTLGAAGVRSERRWRGGSLASKRWHRLPAGEAGS